MEVFKINYRIFPNEDNVIIVSANSTAEAIEKAGLQDAYMYHIIKLGNKSYSRRLGTF